MHPDARISSLSALGVLGTIKRCHPNLGRASYTQENCVTHAVVPLTQALVRLHAPPHQTEKQILKACFLVALRRPHPTQLSGERGLAPTCLATDLNGRSHVVRGWRVRQDSNLRPSD